MERNEILHELREEYMFYSDLIKRNRLDVEHHKYCNRSDHTLCGAKWGHADIMREIIGRIWWWFTGEQPHSVSISRKPKLQHIMEQVFKQRGEKELEDVEYSWLMEIKDRCKKSLANCTEQKSKKSVKGNGKK